MPHPSARHVIPAVALAALLSAGSLATTAVTANAAGSTPASSHTDLDASATAAHRYRITAAGIGPYRVGSSLHRLSAAGLVTDVQEALTCAGYFYAHATGHYAGRISFGFQGDTLAEIWTEDPAVHTRQGGRIGMTLEQLQDVYGATGTIEHGKWTLRAFVVPAGDRVVAFFENPSTGTVYAIGAGDPQHVLASFIGGDDQC
jgi:hypothetical protein